MIQTPDIEFLRPRFHVGNKVPSHAICRLFDSKSASEATQQTVSTQGDKAHAINSGKKNQGATSINGKATALNGHNSLQEGGLQISSLTNGSSVSISTDEGATSKALDALGGALQTAISNRDVITPPAATVTQQGTEAGATENTATILSSVKPIVIGLAVTALLAFLGWVFRKPKSA